MHGIFFKWNTISLLYNISTIKNIAQNYSVGEVHLGDVQFQKGLSNSEGKTMWTAEQWNQ